MTDASADAGPSSAGGLGDAIGNVSAARDVPVTRRFAVATSRRVRGRLFGPATWLGCVLVCLQVLMACGSRTALDVPALPEPEPAEPAEDEDLPVLVCVEPAELAAGSVSVALQTAARLARTDVTLLVDTTASMGDAIGQIRRRLVERIIPAIVDTLPDSHFAVAAFQDFPIGVYGAPTDRPFVLRTPVTDNVAQVQAAVEALRLGNGRDDPESQVEALFQLATGAGLEPYVPPAGGCPRGGVGYPCYRDGALPLIFLFTDAPMHNGPGGSEPYSPNIVPRPHTFDEAVEALSTIGARVVGFSTGEALGRPDLEAIASATGTLDSDGAPLVVDIGRRAQNLDASVVAGFRRFVSETPFDAGAAVRDLPGEASVAGLVESVSPVRAEPAGGARAIDMNTFRGVRPGTRLVFRVNFADGALEPAAEARLLRFAVDFSTPDGAVLGSRIVDLRLPGTGAPTCPATAPPEQG